MGSAEASARRPWSSSSSSRCRVAAARTTLSLPGNTVRVQKAQEAEPVMPFRVITGPVATMRLLPGSRLSPNRWKNITSELGTKEENRVTSKATPPGASNRPTTALPALSAPLA